MATSRIEEHDRKDPKAHRAVWASTIRESVKQAASSTESAAPKMWMTYVSFPRHDDAFASSPTPQAGTSRVESNVGRLHVAKEQPRTVFSPQQYW